MCLGGRCLHTFTVLAHVHGRYWQGRQVRTRVLRPTLAQMRNSKRAWLASTPWRVGAFSWQARMGPAPASPHPPPRATGRRACRTPFARGGVAGLVVWADRKALGVGRGPLMLAVWLSPGASKATPGVGGADIRAQAPFALATHSRPPATVLTPTMTARCCASARAWAGERISAPPAPAKSPGQNDPNEKVQTKRPNPDQAPSGSL